MANFRSHRSRGFGFLGLVVLGALTSPADAQPVTQGYAVERFYPSVPGGGWFVMDDVDISGGLGGAISFTTGYSRDPLVVTGPNGTQRFILVSDEAFADLGLAFTYDRFRLYLNFPVPLLVSGNPDTISDPTIGFDVRLLGKPGVRSVWARVRSS